jgi:hypothetical protein
MTAKNEVKSKMVNVRGLLRQNYMLMVFNTLILVFWVFFLYPMIGDALGYPLILSDPMGFAFAAFSGLFFAGVTYKLLKLRLG